jgi:uncharacterized protein YprB with RNaseH-like and TPR domain
MSKRQQEEVISIATFDIETSNLSADFGRVLCAVVKQVGKKPLVFRGDSYVAWKKGNKYDDSGLVKDIIEELNKHDVLIAHNGLRFDRPFLNTRAFSGLSGGTGGVIVNPRCKMIDPVTIARKHLRFSWNSLARILQHFGLGSKSSVEGHMWLRALLATGKEQRKAMDEVVEHCIVDVVKLEQLVGKLRKFIPRIDEYGSK